MSKKYRLNTKISLKSVFLMLNQVVYKIHGITWKTVFSARWTRFVVKQRLVKYITTKLGGGMMQCMMLLKRNEKNASSANYEEARKNIN